MFNNAKIASPGTSSTTTAESNTMSTIARELVSRFMPGPSGNRLRGPMALGMFAVISIGLSACNPAGGLRSPVKEDPATVCASLEMRKQLIKLIATTDAEGPAIVFWGRKIEPEILQRVAKFWETGDAEIKLIVLESVDPTTNKISCSGQFVLKVPADAVSFDTSVSPPGSTLTEGTIKFSRQPSADGTSYIYRYEDPSNAIAVAPFALAEVTGREKAMADAAASPAAQATDTAEPAAATDHESLGDLIAAEEAVSDGFDGSSYATSAACHKAAGTFTDGLQCEELRKKEEDVELAAAVSVAKSRISQAEGVKLDQAQARWASARDEECDAEGQKDAAVFSTYAAINNSCHFERNKARLRQLAAYPPRRN